MESIDLIRENLRLSGEIVLAGVEDMRDHCLVFPTPRGGGHTLWVLGHLAYIESLVIRGFMLGEPNPLAHWEEAFDGADTSGDGRHFPPFDEVLKELRNVRASTLALLDTLGEADLDRPSAHAPHGVEELFGTHRRCLQYAADHWYMHRGQLVDARRAAGLERAWF
jgi:uncharacterized damage-inducible protein DinB